MATCTRTAAQSQTQTQQGTEETLLPIAQLSACPQHVHGFASHAHQQSSAGSDPSMNHASSHTEQMRPQRHASIAPTSYHPSGASTTAFAGSDSCPTQPNLSSLPVRRNQFRTPPGLQTAIDTPVPADASSSHNSMPHDPMFTHDPWSSAQPPAASHSDNTANAWHNYRGINSAAIHSSAVQPVSYTHLTLPTSDLV